MDSDDDVAAEIAALWGLSNVRIIDTTVSYATRGVLQIWSDEGRFAAKVFRDLDSDDAVKRVQVLLDVSAQGFRNAPNVLTTNAGDCCQRTSAGATVLMEFIPETLDGSASASDWTDLGSAAASLNAHASEPAFAIPVDAALSDQVIRAAGTEYEAGVRALVERLDRLRSAGAHGVIHGELNPSNAGRRATGELVLLDWDEAGMGLTALEYGYPLITCLISEALQVDEAAICAFYDAYRSSGGVVDVSMAIDAALFHALRYMWFSNTAARWERIQFALEAESDLIALIA